MPVAVVMGVVGMVVMVSVMVVGVMAEELKRRRWTEAELGLLTQREAEKVIFSNGFPLRVSICRGIASSNGSGGCEAR